MLGDPRRVVVPILLDEGIEIALLDMVVVCDRHRLGADLGDLASVFDVSAAIDRLIADLEGQIVREGGQPVVVLGPEDPNRLADCDLGFGSLKHFAFAFAPEVQPLLAADLGELYTLESRARLV